MINTNKLNTEVSKTYVNGGVTIDGYSYKQIILSPTLEIRPLVNIENNISQQEVYDFDLCIAKMSNTDCLIVSVIGNDKPYDKDHVICAYRSSKNMETALEVLYPKVLHWLMTNDKEFILTV